MTFVMIKCAVEMEGSLIWCCVTYPKVHICAWNHHAMTFIMIKCAVEMRGWNREPHHPILCRLLI